MNLAHLHLVLNHFPIIGTVIGLGLFVGSFVGKSDDLKQTVDYKTLQERIIKAIHHRLVITLRSLNFQDFSRPYVHPAANEQLTLGYLVGNYAWHGQHHLAHILSTL